MSKITEQIWIGSYQDSTNDTFLKDNRITHILCCAKDCKGLPDNLDPTIYTYFRVPMIEKPVGALKIEGWFRTAAKKLDEWISEGHRVLVHCVAGISRSVSTVITYLILYRKFSFRAAFHLVKQHRVKMNPYSEYLPILKDFGKRMTRKQAGASRIIIFSPERKYLVGKETTFITNIHMSKEHREEIQNLFCRKVEKIKEHDDTNEIQYYTISLLELSKNKEIMDIVRNHSDSTRITFGDIRYIQKDFLYSYTIPQIVKKGTKFSFPGGQPKINDTTISCAINELFEETGINLEKKPYTITRLVDSGKKRGNYHLFYYYLTEEEYEQAIEDIKKKNTLSQAELHELTFMDTNLSVAAMKNINYISSI